MKRIYVLITGVLVIMATVFMNMSEPLEGYGIGDYVADFELPNVDGKMISMSNYGSAKGFIIVFTCNTCPYAKAYESRIIDLDKKYAGKGFPLLAINPNDISQQPGDSVEEMKKRYKNKGYTFPYLRDDSQNVAKAFGATKTPHVYVLNKEAMGKYKVEFIGAIDDSPNDPSDVSETYVENAIDAVLSGNKPTVTKKMAIGCTIKWKKS